MMILLYSISYSASYFPTLKPRFLFKHQKPELNSQSTERAQDVFILCPCSVKTDNICFVIKLLPSCVGIDWTRVDAKHQVEIDVCDIQRVNVH